jgi:hypothetical protein
MITLRVARSNSMHVNHPNLPIGRRGIPEVEKGFDIISKIWAVQIASVAVPFSQGL